MGQPGDTTSQIILNGLVKSGYDTKQYLYMLVKSGYAT